MSRKDALEAREFLLKHNIGSLKETIHNQKRYLDELEKELCETKDKLWIIEKQENNSLIECHRCKKRQGYNVCKKCRHTFCENCVDESSDSFDIIHYTCFICIKRFLQWLLK